MNKDQLKEQVQSLSTEEKKELFKDIFSSIDTVRNTIYSSMEPIYKAVEPIAEAISNFNQSVIEPFQSTVNSILSWFKNIDWQKVNETYDANAKFCNEITQQLESKNIDISILQELNLSQAAELYISSNQCGLTFTDLIEDSIQLFDKFEYNKAQLYMNIIIKRKNQTADNTVNLLNIDLSYVENLKYSEKIIAELVELALREYEKNNISLDDEEKKLLNVLQNRFLDNKELGKILGLQLKEVEESCKKMREKFNIDYFEDDNVKRHLLISLAKRIVIK